MRVRLFASARPMARLCKARHVRRCGERDRCAVDMCMRVRVCVRVCVRSSSTGERLRVRVAADEV